MDIRGKALMVEVEDETAIQMEQQQQLQLQQRVSAQEELLYHGCFQRENVMRRRHHKPIILPPPPPPVLNPSTAQFLFKKVLKLSDVGQARRIIIPKGYAEKYLPPLTDRDGIFIYMDDMDGVRVWVFRFRYWQNNNSRMFVLEKTGDFVKAHGLGAGDSILIYKDHQAERYGIQAKKGTSKQITPPNGINESRSYHGDFIQTDEIGSYVSPEDDMHNFVMNFLGGPVPIVPNVEQSMSFQYANIYPNYFF